MIVIKGLSGKLLPET